MPKASRTKTAHVRRIYEYMDDSGNLFWSFTYLPGRTALRLSLLDNRGLHYRVHVANVQGAAFDKLEGEDGG